MSVLDGFKEVGERTGGKLTMTVMLESVRFSKGVSEVLGRPEFVKLLVNYERGKFAIQVCDENDTPIEGLYNTGIMTGDFYANTYNFVMPGQNLGAVCGTLSYLLGRDLAAL
mgnify:CR=1 FL=1